MSEVIDVADGDDVVVVPPQSPSSLDTDGPATQASLGKSPSKIKRTQTQTNGTTNDVEMKVENEEEDVPAMISTPRSRTPAGENDVKMEAERKMSEKQMEVTQLPNSDTPVLLPPPESQPDPQITNTSPDDAKPPSPSQNGAAVDDKSRKPSSSSGAGQKPKSAKKRSPSPEPLPAPPRLQTVRLTISLGGPENYSVDIVKLAKDTGQRPPTPPPPLIKRDPGTSESEGEDEPGSSRTGVGIGKGKGRGKAGKRSAAAEYYDLDDPFIDDSELAMDQRTHVAQTKQQGFYVSSGEIALLKDKPREKESKERDKEGVVGSPAKKPKSKRAIVPTIIPLAGSQAVNAVVSSGITVSPPTPRPASRSETSPTDPFGSASAGPGLHGTREIPITLSDNEDSKSSISAPHAPDTSVSANGIPNGSALKRKAAEASPSGKKKRKTIEIESFHPELQTALYELKDAISRESFEQKGKFPPSLKPILARVALKAILVGEYNDMFFALMPKMFIYNKYTMTKLIKRTVYTDHQKLLLARQEELLDELATHTREGFEKAKEEYEKSVVAWEKRQEKGKTGATSVEGTPAPGSSTPSVNGANLTLPREDGSGGADSGMEVDGVPPATPAASADRDKDGGGTGHVHSSQHMPIQRFRLTGRMRDIIWELVVLSNESCRIENEKNTLENSTTQVSEQGTRKTLYQKIVACFPDGWMTSGQISREVSVMKKRFEAQQAEGVS